MIVVDSCYKLFYTVTLCSWNPTSDWNDLAESGVDNESYGLPPKKIFQQDKSAKPFKRQPTVQSMESTFLTEIEEWVV